MGNLGELEKRQKGEFEALCKEFRANNKIPADKFDMYNVKAGPAESGWNRRYGRADADLQCAWLSDCGW